MFQSIQGIYRQGKIELLEVPTDLDEAQVIVTFLPPSGAPSGAVDLAARGITPEQAADLRDRLQSFNEDWNHPGMEAYDAL
jgi:uncharacterized membrane protein